MGRAVELVFAVVRSADEGAHGAVRLHDDHGAGIEAQAAALLADVGNNGVLGLLLEREIDGGARGQHVLVLALGDALHLLEGPVEEPVGARGLARLDDLGRVEARLVHLRRSIEARLDQVLQHLVGAGAGRRHVDVGRVFRRRLVKAREQRRLGEVHLAHGLAEIILRRRLDAEGAAAHVGAVEIHLQDLALGKARLEQEGEEHLLDLSLHRTLGREEQVLGELLGERGSALDDLVGPQVLDQSARRAENVDAVVLEETAVLGGERRLDDGVGDLLERHGVVMENAALADLVALLVEELDGIAAGQEAAFVELEEGGQRQRIHDR